MYENLYNWLSYLENQGIKDGFVFFVIVIMLSVYAIWWLIPILFTSTWTYILVLLGYWNDEKRDKFLWHKDTFIYRKVSNLYDEYGYCKKSLFYKFKLNQYHKRHKDSY